jgi:hypothetical protein
MAEGAAQKLEYDRKMARTTYRVTHETIVGQGSTTEGGLELLAVVRPVQPAICNGLRCIQRIQAVRDLGHRRH